MQNSQMFLSLSTTELIVAVSVFPISSGKSKYDFLLYLPCDAIVAALVNLGIRLSSALALLETCRMPKDHPRMPTSCNDQILEVGIRSWSHDPYKSMCLQGQSCRSQQFFAIPLHTLRWFRSRRLPTIITCSQLSAI